MTHLRSLDIIKEFILIPNLGEIILAYRGKCSLCGTHINEICPFAGKTFIKDSTGAICTSERKILDVLFFHTPNTRCYGTKTLYGNDLKISYPLGEKALTDFNINPKPYLLVVYAEENYGKSNIRPDKTIRNVLSVVCLGHLSTEQLAEVRNTIGWLKFTNNKGEPITNSILEMFQDSSKRTTADISIQGNELSLILYTS